MRNNLIHPLVIVAAIGGLYACASDVGERTDTLRVVDQNAITGQLLYMQPQASPYPMTAAQLAESGTDVNEAIPVRIEVFDDLAVAWFAPEGVARVNRDGIIAAWDVVERTPTSGELDNAEVGVVEPGDQDVFVVVADPSGVHVDNPAQAARVELPANAIDLAILDFQDLFTLEELRVIQELTGHHPGCL